MNGLNFHVQDLKTPAGLNFFSLWIRAKETLGMIIVNQLGQDHLIEVLMKERKFVEGKLNILPDIALIEAESGLSLHMTLTENLFTLRKNFKHQIIHLPYLNQEAQVILDENGIDFNATTLASSLNREEQFQVEILKARLSSVGVLIIKDVGKQVPLLKHEGICRQLQDFTEKGGSILYMDSYPDPFFLHCNRLVVYNSGKIEKTFYQDQLRPASIESYLAVKWTPKALGVQKTAAIFSFSYRNQTYHCPKGESLVVLGKDLECLKRMLKLMSGKRLSPELKILSGNPPTYLIPENPIQNSLYLNGSYLFNMTFDLGKKIGKDIIPSALIYSIQKEFSDEIGTLYLQQNLLKLTEAEKLSLVYYKALLIRPSVLMILQPFTGLSMELQIHLLSLINKLKERGIVPIIFTTFLGGLELVAENLLEV